MREIVFRCTANTYGSPFPYISDGTIVILVQQGEASIGHYEEPTGANPFPVFSHPTNNAELKQETLERVKSFYPDIATSDQARTFVCPESLASKAKWQPKNLISA
jgi:hypothetical protein